MSRISFDGMRLFVCANIYLFYVIKNGLNWLSAGRDVSGTIAIYNFSTFPS